MIIDYRIGTYRATELRGDDQAVLKKLGWRVFTTNNEWRTAFMPYVLPLAAFCVGEAAKRVHPIVKARKAEIAASNAATAELDIPVGKGALALGYDFRGYQKAAVIFQDARHKSVNGDIPRLGKMITGIGIVNYKRRIRVPRRVLILSPANAKITWCERWVEWCVHEDLGIDYCEGNHNPMSPALVVNWEILSRHIDYIMAQEWDIVIGDELHRCGGEKSGVTKMTFGPELDTGIPASMAWIGLSGTPIGTRPINFWPICRFMDPKGLGANYWGYARRYCGATKENRGDRRGASNEEELQYLARKAFMVRRDKGDGVELPPHRQTITLPAEGLSRLIRAERSAMQEQLELFERRVHAENGGAISAELAEKDEPVDAAGMASQELALAALPMMVDFINEQLETEDKVVVFAHNRAVAKALRDQFPGCAFVIGGLSTTKRESERKRFQDDPACHVIVGNIHACCENIELSAADVTIYCQLIYQTSLLDQSELRTWLPDKDRPIQIFRLVVAGSASADMAVLMEQRQASIARATVAKHLAGTVV